MLRQVYKRLEQFLVPSDFHTSRGEDLQDNEIHMGKPNLETVRNPRLFKKSLSTW